jgi:hypothetical protein
MGAPVSDLEGLVGDSEHGNGDPGYLEEFHHVEEG